MTRRWRRVVSPSSSALSTLPASGPAAPAVPVPLPPGDAVEAGGAGGRAVYPVASTVAIRSSTDTSAPW
ncbi:hypothetical protein EES46_05310 [Streptomyces sp. ADI98-10]|nr:hypothetical protein EES46_05310 [Streptomyces sp. ADI98-10]